MVSGGAHCSLAGVVLANSVPQTDLDAAASQADEVVVEKKISIVMETREFFICSGFIDQVVGERQS